jgi:hypothetical protein
MSSSQKEFNDLCLALSQPAGFLNRFEQMALRPAGQQESASGSFVKMSSQLAPGRVLAEKPYTPQQRGFPK